MADFEKAIDVVLSHEGGYVYDKDDPGGETKYGISKRSYPDLDIKNLSISQAKEIYRKDFWQPLKLDSFPSSAQDLATETLDFAVNAGIGRATVLLQQAYNIIAPFEDLPNITEDGIFGPITERSLHKLFEKNWSKALLAIFRYLEVHFYLSLPKKLTFKFLKGWLNRI